jgi:hypothetical protein
LGLIQAFFWVPTISLQTCALASVHAGHTHIVALPFCAFLLRPVWSGWAPDGHLKKSSKQEKAAGIKPAAFFVGAQHSGSAVFLLL